VGGDAQRHAAPLRLVTDKHKEIHDGLSITTNKKLSFYIFGSLWSPYGIEQTIIFSCCGLLLFFFFFFFFPRLISAAADVCRTSTHDVALLRI